METYEKKGTLSKFLQNLANISQVLLVCLAFFGYFYTVRPIYQKDLLEEKVAKKELQLSELMKGVEQAKREKTMLINENADLHKKNREMRLVVKDLMKEKESLANQMTQLKTTLSTLNNSYNKIRTDLRINVMKFFREHIKSKLPNVPGYVDYLKFTFNLQNPFAWYGWDRHGEPTAEKVIMDALIDFQHYELLDDQDRRTFITCVNTYLQNHPQQVRKSFNLVGLLDTYKKTYEKVQNDFNAGKYKVFSKKYRKILEERGKEVNNKLHKEFQEVVEDLSSQRALLESITFNAYNDIAERFIKGNDCSR